MIRGDSDAEQRGIRKIPVAVLGATGAVGQTFVRLLARHPLFELAEVAASDRSAGRSYREATHWLDGALPAAAGAMQVARCAPSEVESPLVFSALDSSVAGEIELEFARAGRLVCSNAKNHRMVPDVPLLIPEINASHLRVIDAQRARTGWSGAIVTNANCAATVAALALAPLHELVGVEKIFMSTMQAVSGAGYPGVASLDILGNVIPYIADEEPKIEAEMGKLLGRLGDARIEHDELRCTVHANRVPVEHGHTICMSVGLRSRISLAEAERAIAAWRGCADFVSLAGAHAPPLALTDDPARPQPRRDVGLGNGMTVSVGRLREDALLDLRLVAMGSNTIRGAAGGAILNAELLNAYGYLGTS